ncbi:hypothetical protein [Vibrio sp. T3Y01]|uniref:hypothetical protein n=1 Tax=Vibrio sp. T3Y01 TaxID=2607606 RepID=UPI001493AB9F|nr:hypothetical protein [Vibrio sp. T3Y01]NOI98185.1 hypothetical protein [Vibrio sp. T3Y01]
MEVHTSGVLSYWNMKEFNSEISPRSITEFPLYTDAHVTGELNTDLGPYKFLNMITGVNKAGSIYDAITLRMFWYLEDQGSYGVKTDTSKYHGGWITDEIAALVSVKLGIRIKAGPMTRSYDSHSDDPLGTPSSTRVKPPQIEISARGPVLPSVVKTVDISKLDELYMLNNLTEEQYIALVRASRMFQDALWVAESEPELAWLMLISSVETAANQWSSEQESPTERLRSSKPKLAEILVDKGGEELLEIVATEIVHTLGATNKFIKFSTKFMPEAPEVRPIEWARVKWSKTGFREILDKLYSYRSSALHGGTPFPAPLCGPPDYISKELGIAEKGSIGLATHTLGASWKSEDLPISMDTFTYFVNGVLNNWWRSLLDKES